MSLRKVFTNNRGGSIHNNNKGFTLMELIIGMSVLGLLIAMTAPLLVTQWNNWRDSGAAATVHDQMQSVANGTNQYLISHHGSLPADIPALVTGHIISTAPNPPAAVTAYAFDSSTTPGTVYITTTTDTAGICNYVNFKFGGAQDGDTPAATMDTNKNFQCVGSEGAFTITMKLPK